MKENKGPIEFPIIEGPDDKQLAKIRIRFKRLPNWAQDYITYLERSKRQLEERLNRYESNGHHET